MGFAILAAKVEYAKLLKSVSDLYKVVTCRSCSVCTQPVGVSSSCRDTVRMPKMNDSEMDEEMFTDQDSLSLLQDLPACQSRGAAENDAATDSDTQAGNKEMITETSLNQKNQNQPVVPPCVSSSPGELEII